MSFFHTAECMKSDRCIYINLGLLGLCIGACTMLCLATTITSGVTAFSRYRNNLRARNRTINAIEDVSNILNGSPPESLGMLNGLSN